MKSKICSKCATEKDLESFRSNKDGKLGRHSVCKNCESVHKKKYYKQNRNKILERTAEYSKTTKGIEVNRRKVTRWRINNKDLHNFYSVKYKLRKQRACPEWLNEEQLAEIREIYETRPEGYHVDHIVPLKGKDVSGLHVPWNLRHLPASENISKGNRLMQ